MTRILGIDPGSRRTGYGIIHISQHRITYLASGCISLPPTSSPTPLARLFQALQAIIQQYQPQEAAIEQIFVHRNPRSALVLGQARGVAVLAVQLASLPLSSYAAREVKQAITGYGAARKCQIQHMVQRLLALTAVPPPDAADALAVALCHAHARAIQTRLMEAAGSNRPAKRRIAEETRVVKPLQAARQALLSQLRYSKRR